MADKLGYYPILSREALQKRRTKQLLFFCKDLRNSFLYRYVSGNGGSRKEAGYMMVFNGSMDFEKIRDAMIDGIIMPNEVVTQHYLDTVGRNYRLPVIAASYGNPARFPVRSPV